MLSVLLLAAAAGAVTILLVQRLWAVLRPLHITPRDCLRLLIVAGSGEYPGGGRPACVRHYKPQMRCMLRFVVFLRSRNRYYVIAESDEMSAKKIHSLEHSRAERDSTTE
ncbi:hypothetical protein A6R68_15124, partial [Neotoma lepida]